MFTDTIKETGTYTIRFWIKALAAVTATLECYSFSKDISVTQEWQEVCETFTVAELSDVMLNLPAGEYYIYDNKLEAGTKATPYTVAPEDVDNSILKLNTKYTSLSQTVDGFTATISSLQSSMLEKADSSSVTTVQSNLATLSASVDAFKTTVADTYTTKQSFADGTKDFVTTSTMNSAISQKSDSILLSVSGTYTKQSDFNTYTSGTDAKLELKVNKSTLISEINAAADVITLNADRFSWSSTYSQMDSMGRLKCQDLTCTNAKITGGTINIETATTLQSIIYLKYVDTTDSSDVQTWDGKFTSGSLTYKYATTKNGVFSSVVNGTGISSNCDYGNNSSYARINAYSEKASLNLNAYVPSADNNTGLYITADAGTGTVIYQSTNDANHHFVGGNVYIDENICILTALRNDGVNRYLNQNQYVRAVVMDMIDEGIVAAG